jgi:acyl-CoA thioesterase
VAPTAAPWGDAADLIDMLDVRADGERRFVSVSRGEWQRPVAEASQILGQAIVAAGRHAAAGGAGGRRVVSAHLVAMRAADATRPILFEIDELSSGRTFTTLLVHASQADRRCATTTVLLGETSSDVIRHTAAPPETCGPAASEPYDMGVTGRRLRVVDAAYTNDSAAPVGPPVIDAWVRFDEVPDDPFLHAALLAQFTGHMSIAAALRPHDGIGQEAAHRTISTAINAITISFHADVRADEWMLYRHLSTAAGDGMTHAECRVHAGGRDGTAGDLVASFTVDAMVRPFTDPTQAADPRTAL